MAWQQYDLSDSDADDADVKRSQVGKSKTGGVGWTTVITPPFRKTCFLRHQKFKGIELDIEDK